MKRETTKPRTTCESCADGECRHVAIIQRQATELRRLRAALREERKATDFYIKALHAAEAKLAALKPARRK